MVSLGKQLKNLRADKGLSQKAVAVALEISTTCYAGYEQGYREPDLATFKKLCLFFEVSADELLGISDN